MVKFINEIFRFLSDILGESEDNQKSYITYEVEVYDDGTKFWYLNNVIHREDDGAIEYPNGNKLFFLNGVQHTEEEFNKRVNVVLKWRGEDFNRRVFFYSRDDCS